MSKAKEDYYRYEKMLLDKYHVNQTASGRYIRELEQQNKQMLKMLIHYANNDFQFYLDNQWGIEESFEMITCKKILEQIIGKSIKEIIK